MGGGVCRSSIGKKNVQSRYNEAELIANNSKSIIRKIACFSINIWNSNINLQTPPGIEERKPRIKIGRAVTTRKYSKVDTQIWRKEIPILGPFLANFKESGNTSLICFYTMMAFRYFIENPGHLYEYEATTVYIYGWFIENPGHFYEYEATTV